MQIIQKVANWCARRRESERRGVREWFCVTALLGATGLAQAGSLSTGWVDVSGVEIFFREAGDANASTILFLHGNPSSSLQYARVMEELSDRFHVIAMDYPSFGFSASPDRVSYPYTFENLASTVAEFLRSRGVERYAMFMQDYGVPIGFRLATRKPGAVSALIIQNGVIHLDGFPAAQDSNGELRQHWKHRDLRLDERRRAYTISLRFPAREGWEWPGRIPPEFVLANQAAGQRPGVMQARNDLWFDYGSNVELYPRWQALLRQLAVPVLVVWGGRDTYFTVPGAFAYVRDSPGAEIHVLDADHFATVELPEVIAEITREFLARRSVCAKCPVSRQ